MLAALACASVAAADPALDYTLNCQGCHRADGVGTPGSVPALAGSVGRFLAVPGGREYLSRVPGVSQAGLDDAALAEVLNWMVDRFDREHVPAGFAKFTAAEVGPLRKNPLIDPERVRAELLGRVR